MNHKKYRIMIDLKWVYMCLYLIPLTYTYHFCIHIQGNSSTYKYLLLTVTLGRVVPLITTRAVVRGITRPSIRTIIYPTPADSWKKPTKHYKYNYVNFLHYRPKV